MEQATSTGGDKKASAQPESILERVERLRHLAKDHEDAARDATWNWFRELGQAKDTDTLNRLFAAGKPPSKLDGPTDGMLVVATIQPYLDPVVRILAGIEMPWKGKRFFASENRGENRFIPNFVYPARLLWPGYNSRTSGDERAAFDFETRVEPSADDPRTEVLVIDYAPLDSNPGFLIRQIRDELVEIVPGANLGKILHRHGEAYDSWGFFALRPA